jgi:hypothetical protein
VGRKGRLSAVQQYRLQPAQLLAIYRASARDRSTADYNMLAGRAFLEDIFGDKPDRFAKVIRHTSDP